MEDNRTMMQYFEWYLPNDGLWWKRCAAKASSLKELGISEVWLPPAYKAISQDNPGYAVYDMYDLGEFDQKESVRTKYGTKDEYKEAVEAFHAAGINVFADIVLNHRMGGDEMEEITATPVNPDNRNEVIGEPVTIKCHSRFTFPGRNGCYSSFVYDHNHFSGCDVDESGEHQGIFLFEGKHWAPDTDSENGNYDYLMGLNVDVSNEEVREEIFRWLCWYVQETGIDALRLDAVKHISAPFYADLLHRVRSELLLPLPAVGEYWNGDPERLNGYLENVDERMSLFDVSLHYNFFNAAEQGGDFDMRQILANTLVEKNPSHAVTFVDNHDTENGQALQSFVQDWFKQIAYGIILLRQEGIPCIFYADYYGNPVMNRPAVLNLKKLLRLRKLYAYGEQRDYFDDPDIVGWVREGDEHKNSGLAVLISNRDGGSKRMEIGKRHAGMVFRDALGNCTQEVVIGEDGFGEFFTAPGDISVWTREEAFEKLVITD